MSAVCQEGISTEVVSKVPESDKTEGWASGLIASHNASRVVVITRDVWGLFALVPGLQLDVKAGGHGQVMVMHSRTHTASAVSRASASV